ncbi:MAG: LytTR family transcriptional regulator [Mitsuaria chitosanitabida]|nr:LytTR family transcriptional regulator [Roseateles chitosanitabidus]
MVGLRKVAYATQGAHYDFGDWPVEFFYEALKDLRSYAFILTVVGAYRLLVWRWQGEASLLAEAPGAAPASLPSPAVGSNRNPNLDPSPSPSLVRQTSPPSLPMPTSLASAAEAEPAREPDPAPAPPPLPRPERLLVKKLGKEFLLPMDEIEWIQACGNYVNLHRQQHDYPLRSSLGAFEQRIDPREFVRVHRSYLVRLRLIEAIEPTEAGDAHLRLRDGSRLPCSRTYLERLRQRLA